MSLYEAYFSLQREVFLCWEGSIIIFLLQLGKLNFVKDKGWNSMQIFRVLVPQIFF